MSKFRAVNALAAAALILAACSDGSEPLVPGSLEIMGGDDQTAVAGSLLPVAPSVRLLSTTGKPMPGVKIRFASSGDGIVTPTEQVTDAQGIAAVTSWTLPTRAGDHLLTASTAGLAPLQIKGKARAGAAAALKPMSAEQQTASVAGNAAPPVVQVNDANGNPVSGVEVTFTASAGTVRVPAATTDLEGFARAESWTLGVVAGQQTVTASVPSVASVAPVVFTAQAQPLAASGLRITRAPSANPRAGIVVAVQPVVQIADVHGNAVSAPNISVTAAVAGDVTVTNGVATTNANGTASFSGMTLSGAAGNYVLSFGTGSHVPAELNVTLEAGAPAKLAVVRQPSTSNGSGEPLQVQPIVEIHDLWGNRVLPASLSVTASLPTGATQTLSGTTTVPAVGGRATFTDLVISGPGTAQLRFTASGLPEATSASFNIPSAPTCPGAKLKLDYLLGQSSRFVTTSPDTPFCLDFTMAANKGQQFLVQFENITSSGNSDTGLFPGVVTMPQLFSVGVSTGTVPSSSMTATAMRARAPANAVHSWDFGDGEVFEIEPKEPVGGARAYVQRNNLMFDASAGSAVIVVGDTIVAHLEGIQRLNIPSGMQKAVVRFVSTDLIIAEDVRLPTLPRQNGGFNSPMSVVDMELIAADYARYAKAQADKFFGGRHNSATEAGGGKVIAIHTLMFQDNIWGYTYSRGNYFAWDYWVLSDGVTKGNHQQIERNSNNLFMHEIAHMRHWGMQERAGKPVRGNRWLVEGFARATERWPIAMRLMGTSNPSRIGNIALPLYSTAALNSLEDVPAYTRAQTSFYGGYANSSYIFDYFADQVAKTTGTDWMTALGDFLINAGSEFDLNHAISRYLPGLDFTTLLTRARVALYTDDYDAALPDWTQFHQFRLRQSRQTGEPEKDPRNLWPKIAPGAAFAQRVAVGPGQAFGYIIDGTAASADARILLDPARADYGVVSITRIK